MNLALDDNEARALLAMLDFAVKAQGLAVAETCLVLAKKVEAAGSAEINRLIGKEKLPPLEAPPQSKP